MVDGIAAGEWFPLAAWNDGRFGAVGAARLGQDGPHVVGGGVGADEQGGADVAVRAACRDEPDDLDQSEPRRARPPADPISCEPPM